MLITWNVKLFFMKQGVTLLMIIIIIIIIIIKR